MAFDDLYREIILDHSRYPRNRENLDYIPDDRLFENPTCGDSVKTALELDNSGHIVKVMFDGDGCAVSTASASMMTELLKGKSAAEALESVNRFIGIMSGSLRESLEDWGELEALEGVKQFPQRVKCATLPWHSVKDALERISC